MRLAAAAATAAILLSGCLETRTGAFRCGDGDTCEDGRTCVDGWCVLMSNPIDAPIGDDGSMIDAPLQCPAACTRCEGATCVIECIGGLACMDPVVCPANFDCQVVCEGSGSCAGGIDCTAGGDCDLDCTGDGSCGGAITCSGGRCNIDCSGSNACDGGLDCSAACACDTSCSGPNACSMSAPVCRPGNPCTDGNDDCTSGPGACDNC